MDRSERQLGSWERLLRRRRFIVRPRLQMRLLLGTLWHLGLVLLVGVGVLFVPVMIELATHDLQSSKAAEAADALLFLHERYWPSLALLTVLLALDAIRTSHRIAGPLFRFTRVLEEVRQGRVPPPVTLRSGDFLTEECGLINEALRDLATRRVREERDRARIRAAVAAVRAELDGDPRLLPAQRAVLAGLLSCFEDEPSGEDRVA